MTERRFQTLERWSPTLLLLGGIVAVIFAGLFAIEASQDTTLRTQFAAGTAFTLAFAGLLGRYPTLVDQTPWLARIGGACAALGLVGFATLPIVEAAKVLEILATPAPDWVAFLNLPRVIGLIFGFLLLGIATLKHDDQAPGVGVFLLLPAVAFALNFIVIVANDGASLSPWWAAAITLGEAIGLLGAGYLLRTAATRTADTDPSRSQAEPLDQADQ